MRMKVCFGVVEVVAYLLNRSYAHAWNSETINEQ